MSFNMIALAIFGSIAVLGLIIYSVDACCNAYDRREKTREYFGNHTKMYKYYTGGKIWKPKKKYLSMSSC